MLLFVLAMMLAMSALFGWYEYDRAVYQDGPNKAVAAWAIGYHNSTYALCIADEEACNAGNGPLVVTVPAEDQPAYAQPTSANWGAIKSLAEAGKLFTVVLLGASGNASTLEEGQEINPSQVVSRLVEMSGQSPGSGIRVGVYDAATSTVYFSNYYESVDGSNWLQQILGVTPAFAQTASKQGLVVNFGILGQSVPQGTPVIMSYIGCNGPECGATSFGCAEGPCPAE